MLTVAVLVALLLIAIALDVARRRRGVRVRCCSGGPWPPEDLVAAPARRAAR